MTKAFKGLILAALAFAATWTDAAAQANNLAIATGGTGGIFYPLGGGMASVITKSLPGVAATVEVTGGSVDNMKLIASSPSYLGMSVADTAYEAYKGVEKFKNGALPLRTLLVMYPGRSQIVTLDGIGITKLSDLKGRRVSTGAPGSASELWAFRILEAAGIDKDKDVKRERLSVGESASALRDRKIDAFFWGGGVPTAAVVDLALTPGVKVRLLDHLEVREAMNTKYGPLYAKDLITKDSYSGMPADATGIAVWSNLYVHEKMPEEQAYAIVKALFEKHADLVAVHQEARSITLANQVMANTGVPFHPGVVRYLKEKGLDPQR